MKYVFIGGIPASGKSYLAEKIADKIDAIHIDIDDLRETMGKNPKLEPWVNFFFNQNEREYWENTSCKKHWENLKNQSEAFWPVILKKIKEVQDSGKSAIFEGVNILPHLASRDLNFEGIFLLGESLEIIFERNKKNPRWGKTPKLQKIEAEKFYECERLMYKEEAEKYDFKTFKDSREAEKEILQE